MVIPYGKKDRLAYLILQFKLDETKKHMMQRTAVFIDLQERCSEIRKDLVGHYQLNNTILKCLDVSSESELYKSFNNNTVAIALIFFSSDYLEQDLKLICTIRSKLKEKNTRIIAIINDSLNAAIEDLISNHQIDGFIIESELNKKNLEIALTLALRNYERINEVKEDYERLRLIRRFSVENNHFVKAIYHQLLEDRNIRNVTIFEARHIVYCSGNKETFKKVYQVWETTNKEVIDKFIFLRIRELENYVIAIESINTDGRSSKQTSLNLMEYVLAVREKIIEVVKNDKLLLDLYFVSTNRSNLIWIEALGRGVKLHLSDKSSEFVNQQLKTICQFFTEDYLLQINRSILINTSKIKRIDHKSSRSISIKMKTGPSFSVSRSNIKKVEQLFKNRQLVN